MSSWGGKDLLSQLSQLPHSDSDSDDQKETAPFLDAVPQLRAALGTLKESMGKYGVWVWLKSLVLNFRQNQFECIKLSYNLRVLRWDVGVGSWPTPLVPWEVHCTTNSFVVPLNFDPARPHLAAMKLAGNHFSLFLGSTVEILFEAIIRSGGGLLWAAESEGNERKWQQIFDDIDPGSETDQTVAMPHGCVWK